MFNEILVGRLNRYVQKLLVIKNTALRNLAPELQTVLPLFSGNEERYLQGWTRFGIVKSATAVAAQNSFVQLSNPASSGVVAIIEKVFINGTVTTQSRADCGMQGGNVPDAANSFFGFRIDSRGNPSSASHFSWGNAVSPAFAAGILSVGFSNLPGIDLIITDNDEITLLPGDTFRVVDNTVNESFNVSMHWRERVLESSELT